MSSYEGSRSARQSKRYSMSALYLSMSANESDLEIEDDLAKGPLNVKASQLRNYYTVIGSRPSTHEGTFNQHYYPRFEQVLGPLNFAVLQLRNYYTVIGGDHLIEELFEDLQPTLLFEIRTSLRTVERCSPTIAKLLYGYRSKIIS
ncbi:uncharacterized protein GGS25DRAFT_528125 [Hypoxylon fragiforme]|uniref:uncharacterized protein n=1 Tax=Hypoxylon fragiforme TaxID=63214 RepID=UPI0020C70D27|nr:uncharacterized protein GGS25DRAFT_528125 [Hypoxylon fragiforme]KAI2603114.1 hypothetical protein GGS25DRAFT_528125 [Hypoxylon fragiforme]